MAKATKLPSGKYRCLACRTVDGKKVRKSFTADIKKEAERKAAAWICASTSEKMTLKNACDMYINEKNNILSPVTIETYKGYMRRYLTEYMDKHIQNITKNNLQSAFNVLAGKLLPKTIKCVWGFYRAVFLRCGYDIKIKLPTIPKRIYHVADVNTAKKILEIVKGTEIETPIILAMCYGLRISEICGLKWENVKPYYIDIVETKVMFGTKYYTKAPKTAAGRRRIPISQADYNIFIKNKSGIMVYSRSPNYLRVHFRKLLAENDLPSYNIHSLRHTFASVMAIANVPRAYAKAIGGWETDSVLSQIYTQTFEAEQVGFMADVQGIFQGQK